jgi:carboxylesterase type B
MQYLRRTGYTNLDSGNGDTLKNICTTKTVLGIAFLGVAFSVVALLALGAFDSSNRSSAKLFATDGSSGPQVEIDLGILEGKVLQTRGGRDYYAFYNIPYAKPAVGELRFEPPQEYTEKWTGVRNATVRGNKCIQNRKGMTEIQGSEDCHYLNVYTPKLPETNRRGRGRGQAGRGRGRRGRGRQIKLLPVMFYMFGGGFKGGQGSNYGGDYMLDKDVVIVLPEWRLGAMGYLSTGDEVISGNMGFKDQVMALKWVQKNIERFNGDPGKVTIFGNSAGAMSVHAHLLSNMSRGLFHRAISQSGVALTAPNGILMENPREKTNMVGKYVGCPDLVDSKALAKCLKEADAADVLNGQGMQLFSLCVEAVPENGDTSNLFLSEIPLHIMQQGRMNPDVPWIIGVNDGEKNLNALDLDDPVKANFYNNSWELAGPTILNYNDDANHTLSTKIREFYFGDKDIGRETRINFTDAVNDREFIHPSVTSANLRASFNNTSPVYLYWLSKLPLISVGDPLKESYGPPYGVAHSDEVQFLFLFLNDKFPYIGKDSPDYNQSMLMVDIWTTFADTGQVPDIWTPVPKGNVGNGDKIWFHLDADKEVKMFNPEGVEERIEFWDQFPLNQIYVNNVTLYNQI